MNSVWGGAGTFPPIRTLAVGEFNMYGIRDEAKGEAAGLGARVESTGYDPTSQLLYSYVSRVHIHLR